MKKLSFAFFLFLFVATALLGAGSKAYALSSEWVGIDETQVRLISAQNAVGKEKTLRLGLQFKMIPGWKVYWRSPGDAGYPPEVDWTGSDNFESADMRWPRPERFSVLGLETVGYKKEVVYPIDLTLNDTGQNVALNTQVRFLTCSEICVPVERNISLTIPSGPAQPSEFAQLINRFASQVPLTNHSRGISIEQATAHVEATEEKGGTLRLSLASENLIDAPDVLVEGPVELAFFSPTVSLASDKKNVTIHVPFDGLQFLEAPLEDQDLTVTFLSANANVELVTKAKISKAPLPEKDLAAAPTEKIALSSILLLAVLGGLILNLMPCVLPVLSLKILGLVSHGGADPRPVRAGFIASSAGILFSFWILAAGLIALKAAGASIGWGIQFQQPLFLIALCSILILFACNMWGVFEINLPGWLSDIGQKSSHSNGLGGHFLTGAFATLLATPCSAPFLGTAVGFALSRGAFEIWLVFSCLGVGLALPYLLIAAFPRFATRLPKPGPWMIHLRKFLGVALLGTALWLITVLMAQIGLQGAIIIAAIMLGVIAVFFLRTKIPAPTALLVIVLYAAAFAVPSFSTPTTAQSQTLQKIWTPFERDQIATLISQNQIVFVDVTADWCITCQVNKKLVLHQGDVYQRLTQSDVIAMKADWTNPDPIISDFLASFGKYAIPFNIIYGPAAPEGIVLPELLTEKVVLAAIKKAKG